MSGYIKLDRKIMEWEWYRNEHTKNVFLHCLLKANWKDGSFEGKLIKRGSFVTSIKKISLELDLTEDEVRTAIKHLLKTGEITKQTTNKYSVITVSNYELYQDVPEQFPNNSHSIPKPFPTIEEGKNIRREEWENENNNNSCATESHDTEQLDEFFNSIWKLYPIKKGKGQVSKTKKKVLQRIGFDELKRCVERFIRDMESENRDRKYWMHGSTFFNSGYVDYLDENCLSEKQIGKPPEEPEIEEEEVPDDEGDYIDFGAMTDEEFAEFLRVQNGRCV